MAGHAQKKPSSTRKRTSRVGKRAAASILERLTPYESATVLKVLLEHHRALRGEAEKIATELVSSPALETIADDVLATLTIIGVDAMSNRAGKKPWGYVEPTEAAWELLEEAAEGFIADMRRRMELGLADTAASMCRGIVVGLHKAKKAKSDGALAWAPDFPAEEACYVVAELLRACPAEKQKDTRDRLLDALAGDVPDWSKTLARTAGRRWGCGERT